ncbi:hypothetical protein SMICM17S_04695 [Streptomyces microflavus]
MGRLRGLAEDVQLVTVTVVRRARPLSGAAAAGRGAEGRMAYGQKVFKVRNGKNHEIHLALPIQTPQWGLGI